MRPPTRPVKIFLDGDTIVGDADASLTASLLGAGHLLLARSPKFHRPRGPCCMRGGCDGCLMRVDGGPNVMTCTRTPREGTRVERQNVILTPKLDVLRATDWFFPNGMNHHLMFAGIPGVQQVVQAFARRVSGLGELPEDVETPIAGPVPSIATDVLVVGGGPSGLATAIALRRHGVRVLLVDDSLALGGSLRSFPPGARVQLGEAEVDIDALLARQLEALDKASVEVRSRATVVGVLEGNDWLFDATHDDPALGPQGLCRVEARAHILATGGHDPIPLYEGNDLPGVFSARAAGRLLREGVLVGDEIVVAGEGPFSRAFEEAARSHGADVRRVARIESVRGLSRVRSVVGVDASGANVRTDADAVVVDGAVAPSFELAVQAGAAVRHVDAGYSVLVDDGGRVLLSRESAELTSSDSLFAIGEVVGGSLAEAATMRAAERLAITVARALEPPPRSQRSRPRGEAR